MTFLSPWSAVLAAAIFVPLLLVLYFLRLRRHTIRLPSTLLWMESFKDLQVNVPFQRLKWSLLLIVQLLLLLALILALADPIREGKPARSSRAVLLIDCSASMKAIVTSGHGEQEEQTTTRFDLVRRVARDLIRTVGEGLGPRELMIIAFGQSAHVISSFESDFKTLLDAVETLEPSDEEADLDAALKLAGAFAVSSEESPVQMPEVILVSDGCTTSRDASRNYTLRSGKFRNAVPDEIHAHAVRNVGIVSLSARRDYEDPMQVHVFVRLLNAGDEPAEVNVTFRLNGEPVSISRKSLPGSTSSELGELSFTTTLFVAENAIITVDVSVSDDLDSDNISAIVMPRLARPRVALVHPAGDGDKKGTPDPFLIELLNSMDTEFVRTLTRSAYEALDPELVDSGELFDLVIFDRVAVSTLPNIATVSFGAVPSPLLETETSSSGGKLIMSWDRQHPLMRHVSLDALVYTGFGALRVPDNATALAFGPDGPVIAMTSTRRVKHVCVGFSLRNSNWPLHVSSAIFIQNAMDYLTRAGTGQTGLVYRPGDTLTVYPNRGISELVIEGPIKRTILTDAGDPVLLTVPNLSGVYRIRGAATPHDRLAVSVLSELESDLRPRGAIQVNSEVQTADRASSFETRPLWMWLVAVAFLLVILEWLLYCRRVRV